MAKKLYAVPIKKVLGLIKEYKGLFTEIVEDNKLLEYYKLLGKSYYFLEIEKNIKFYKIDKDINRALKNIESFNSKIFINEIASKLNFSQFKLEKHKIEIKDFFYAFLYLLQGLDKKVFEYFLEKLFIHYYITFNMNSNININFQEMAVFFAKNRKISLKESFGEKESNIAYFKILEDNKVVVSKEGKSIKTLRKQAYKEYFYYLIELQT